MAHRLHNRLVVATGLSVSLLFSTLAHAQESHWAAPNDATAKMLIDWERQWAEAGCTHNGIQRRSWPRIFKAPPPTDRVTPSSKPSATAQATNRRKPPARCTK